MSNDKRHHAFLSFTRRVIEVPLGYSRDDLIAFQSRAAKEFEFLQPVIKEYVRIADHSATNVKTALRGKVSSAKPVVAPMHLFDLLRDKRLFPQNADLADFAAMILPTIQGRRFHKMSRGDIAARIIEDLERRDSRARIHLEASMREAMSNSSAKPQDRKDFFSKWERIIKGIEL